MYDSRSYSKVVYHTRALLQARVNSILLSKFTLETGLFNEAKYKEAARIETKVTKLNIMTQLTPVDLPLN